MKKRSRFTSNQPDANLSIKKQMKIKKNGEEEEKLGSSHKK